MIWAIIAGILLLATLPGTIELLWLTIGAMLAPVPYAQGRGKAYKIAVVIPAYNEASHIQDAIRSLRKCRGDFQIVVLADNCTDNTADLAKTAGAKVIVRKDLARRGKHYALQHAFEVLIKEPIDLFVVLDADSTVQDNLVEAIQSEFDAGAEAVQVRYGLLNPQASIKERFLNIAFTAFNYVRPKGRQRWGLSCGIMGNGFALNRQTLLKVPYITDSLVEDLSYHLKLVRKGIRVRFTDATNVWAHVPSSLQGAGIQRTRWEGGRLRVMMDEIPQLIREVLGGQFRLVEPLLDLLLLPLVYHLSLILLLFFLAKAYAYFALGVVLLHVAVAFKLARGNFSDALALLITPFYLIWKLCLLPKTLLSSKKDSPWVRTKRD